MPAGGGRVAHGGGLACHAPAAQTTLTASRLWAEERAMATTGTFKPYTKAEIIQSLQGLPDDATVDDAMERLAFLAKLEIAHAQLAAGDTFTQEQVEREMAEW